MKYFKLKPD